MKIPVLLMCAAVCPGLLAQEKPAEPAHNYKVDFTLKDGSDSGGVRHFSMLIDAAGGLSVFRTGTRVPVLSGKDELNSVEVGVNIDCRLREQGGRALLNATIDVSTLAPSAQPVPMRPQIAQTRVMVNAALQPGKPTLVASIEDPVQQRRLDVEATLTRVD